MSVFQRRVLIEDISVWINGQAVDMNFVMYVRTGGTAGVSYHPYLLASLHPLAALDVGFVKVSVNGLQSIPVGDTDEPSIAVIRPCSDHNTVGRRNNW